MVNRLMMTLVIASVAVIAAAGWWALDGPVARFVIRGDLTDLEQKEIRRVLSEADFGSVLTIRFDEVKATLNALPWAQEVTIHRAWPDALIVSLHKATPIARWGEGQYLSAAGQVVDLPDEYPGVPSFSVQVDTPEQAIRVYRLLDQVFARAGLDIDGLDQNAQGEWTVSLVSSGTRANKDKEQRFDVLLGSEQLNERSHRFLLVHRRALEKEDQKVVYVDARYSSGVAVRFDDEEEQENLVGLVEDAQWR